MKWCPINNYKKKIPFISPILTLMFGWVISKEVISLLPFSTAIWSGVIPDAFWQFISNSGEVKSLIISILPLFVA